VATGVKTGKKAREDGCKRLHKNVTGLLEKVNKKASPKARTQPDQKF